MHAPPMEKITAKARRDKFIKNASKIESFIVDKDSIGTMMPSISDNDYVYGGPKRRPD